MNRADADSIYYEAIELPYRVPYEMPTWSDEGFCPLNAHGTRGPSCARIVQSWTKPPQSSQPGLLTTNGGYKGYPTGENLLGFAAYGVDLIKAIAAGEWYADYRQNNKIGCCRRSADGKKYICKKEHSPSLSSSNYAVGNSKYWESNCLTVGLSPWTNKDYKFKTKRFTAENLSRELVTIDGDNQYLMVKDLDDFLKVKHNNGWIIPNRCHTRLTPYDDMYAGQFVIRTYGQFGPEDWYTCDALGSNPQNQAPVSISATLYLEDEASERSTLCVETVTCIGRFVQLTADYLKYGVVGHAVPTYLYISPEDWSELISVWGTIDDLYAAGGGNSQKNPTEYQTLLKRIADLKALWLSFSRIGAINDNLYLPKTASDFHWNNSFPAFIVVRQPTPVFLKKGKTYNLILEVDNIYTPLQISTLNTIQSQMYYKPVRVPMANNI